MDFRGDEDKYWFFLLEENMDAPEGRWVEGVGDVTDDDRDKPRDWG